MNVDELFDNSNNLLGKVVEVQGIFVFCSSVGYFVSIIDNRDNESGAFKVDVPNLKEVLMRSVPPSGGSKYYYLDSASIIGTLNKCLDGVFPLSIGNVTSLTIVKSGELFTAI